MNPRRFGPALEAYSVWGLIAVLLSVLNLFRDAPTVARYLPLLAAVLFLYLPPLLVRLRGGERDFFDDLFSPEVWKRGALWAALAALVVFPPFVLGHYFWMTQVMHMSWVGFRWAPPPGGWLSFALSQLLLVALSEEFFYRGYLFTRLNQEYLVRRSVLGVKLGPGWLIQALLFALGHFLVGFRLFRLNVFFPALLFGWLKVRSRSLTAPLLLHALSNLLMSLVSGWYR